MLHWSVHVFISIRVVHLCIDSTLLEQRGMNNEECVGVHAYAHTLTVHFNINNYFVVPSLVAL